MAKLSSPSKNQLEHDLGKRRLQAGWLGKFFGVDDQMSKFIAALIAIFLLLIGVVVMFVKQDSWSEVMDFWTKIFPFITLVVGYILGKGKNEVTS